MSEDVRAECARLFMACAPFVRAEQDAEEALIAARKALKAYQSAAAIARATWVDFLLAHDHKTTCDRQAAGRSGTAP